MAVRNPQRYERFIKFIQDIYQAFAVITNVIGQGAGKDLPYEAPDESYSYLSGKTIWEVKRAKRKNNGEIVTAFVFDFTNKSEDEIKLARSAFMRLKTLRHPNVLKFLDGVELPTSLHMITEEAVPLQVSLEDEGSGRSNYSISWGIHQILKAISFLNNDCGLIHRNLCQSSVFVDAAGEWKLGGMEFVWQFSEDALPPPKLLQNLNKYNPPEIANEMRGKKITKWSTDMWGLGCLIHEVFNGPLTQISSLRNTSKIPNSLVSSFCQLVGANPKSRPNPSTLLSDLQKHGGYLSNQFVSVNLSIEEVQIMEPSQRSAFFKELDKHLDSFPDNFCKKKILPQLINAFEFGGAGSSVLSPLFKLGKLLDSEEYQSKIVPCVVKLFSSTDRATRVNLLQQLDQFVEHLQPSTVNDQIFPHVAIGFTDTLPAMREQTIKAMLLLAPKLNEKTLNTQLLRHLAKCQVDEKEGIRTNTTVCLGRVAPYLSPSTRSKILVSAFLRALKDPFPPARVAGLKAMSATQEYYNTMDIATRLLPALSTILVDRDKSVRDQAFIVLRLFVDKLETISENPELQKSESDASTATSWLGWASSITSTKTNPTTTADAAGSSSKEEVKPTIKSDSDKEKQTSSTVVVEKTSDQEEEDNDDDHWEDGGWGEEDNTVMTMNDNKTSGDGWNNDEEWASFEDDRQDDVPHSATSSGLKLKPTSDPFAELQVNSTAKRNNKSKEKEPSWEDFLGSSGSSANQPRYEHKQPTPPPVKASLFDNPSTTSNSWTNSGWEDDTSFGDWGQDIIPPKTTQKSDTQLTIDKSGWEEEGWGDFEAEQLPKKSTSNRDAERKKIQEERRLKQQQARQKRSAGLGGTKPSGLGDVKKD